MRTMGPIVLLSLFLVALSSKPALAHCDALDGPVVKAARIALDRGDVSRVLPWVRSEDEAEVRAAFTRTLQVRALGEEARGLADTWFFETLVRIHRTGEGAPFDGLKPSGHIDPVLAAADHTLDSGSADGLIAEVTGRVAAGMRRRFAAAREAQAVAKAAGTVEAGRTFVAAYVDYLHYVERLHGAATSASTSDAHEHAAPAPAAHQHDE